MRQPLLGRACVDARGGGRAPERGAALAQGAGGAPLLYAHATVSRVRVSEGGGRRAGGGRGGALHWAGGGRGGAPERGDGDEGQHDGGPQVVGFVHRFAPSLLEATVFYHIEHWLLLTWLLFLTCPMWLKV